MQNHELLELRGKVLLYLESLTDQPTGNALVTLLNAAELSAVGNAIDHGQELLVVELLGHALRRTAADVQRATIDQVAQKHAAAGGSAF